MLTPAGDGQFHIPNSSDLLPHCFCTHLAEWGLIDIKSTTLPDLGVVVQNDDDLAVLLVEADNEFASAPRPYAWADHKPHAAFDIVFRTCVYVHAAYYFDIARLRARHNDSRGLLQHSHAWTSCGCRSLSAAHCSSLRPLLRHSLKVSLPQVNSSFRVCLSLLVHGIGVNFEAVELSLCTTDLQDNSPTSNFLLVGVADLTDIHLRKRCLIANNPLLFAFPELEVVIHLDEHLAQMRQEPKLELVLHEDHQRDNDGKHHHRYVGTGFLLTATTRLRGCATCVHTVHHNDRPGLLELKGSTRSPSREGRVVLRHANLLLHWARSCY
mmetsp:Transcript_71597/g.171176  ORF Transcript_71597/g.171176 Transcript_71597/m.171176 type:complete len:325 (-) Transcript_71597:85-1059(-)